MKFITLKLSFCQVTRKLWQPIWMSLGSDWIWNTVHHTPVRTNTLAHCDTGIVELNRIFTNNEKKQTGDTKYVTIKISQLVMEKMLPYKKSERWHKTNDLFPRRKDKFCFFSFIKLVLSGICHWRILSDCSNVWLGLFTWQMCFKRSVFKLAWLASSAAWLAEMVYRFIFRLSKVCWFIWLLVKAN